MINIIVRGNTGCHLFTVNDMSYKAYCSLKLVLAQDQTVLQLSHATADVYRWENTGYITFHVNWAFFIFLWNKYIER